MTFSVGMRRLVIACAGAFMVAATSAAAQDKLQFNYLMHDRPEGVFWNAVLRGMNDACADLDIDCQMIGTQAGDPAQQVANFQASIAAGVDGIVTTIPNDQMFDQVVQDALDAGIPVIAANTDDPEGEAGNARLSYTGSNVYNNAYNIAQAATEMFPEGDIHVLIGSFDQTHVVAIQRSAGMIKALEEWKAANPDRNITWEEIEEKHDPGTVRNRVGAYLQAVPETNVYLTTSVWHPDVAAMLREEGREPGEILIAGFGTYTKVVDEIKAGWIALTDDQGAYLQGYLPIVQLKLLARGLAPFNVDTAGALKGVVDAGVAATLSDIRIWSF